jgi:hypothetical protein
MFILWLFVNKAFYYTTQYICLQKVTLLMQAISPLTLPTTLPEELRSYILYADIPSVKYSSIDEVFSLVHIRKFLMAWY